MYSSSEVQKELIPLSTLHMMISSHSLFLPTMLDSNEELSMCQAKGMYGVEYNGGTNMELHTSGFILRLIIFLFYPNTLILLSFQKR